MIISAQKIFDNNEAAISRNIGVNKSVSEFTNKHCGNRRIEADFWLAIATTQKDSFVEGFETALSLFMQTKTENYIVA
jgi:hypothetical protein